MEQTSKISNPSLPHHEPEKRGKKLIGIKACFLISEKEFQSLQSGRGFSFRARGEKLFFRPAPKRFFRFRMADLGQYFVWPNKDFEMDEESNKENN